MTQATAVHGLKTEPIRNGRGRLDWSREDEDVDRFARGEPGFRLGDDDQGVGPAERGYLVRALPGQRGHLIAVKHAAQVRAPSGG